MRLSTLLDKAMSLIYPKRCVFCGDISGGEIACERCASRHRRITPPVCFVCGCGGECHCRDGLHFDRVTAPFYYEGRARDDILSFKYHGKHEYGRYFAHCLCGAVRENYGGGAFDVVTCVPMYNGDRTRPFDHAAYLARAAADELGVPYDGGLIVRTRLGERQHSLGSRDRMKNVRGMYAPSAADLSGKTVLLIDDISTSGATFSECAGVLKGMGARRVYCASAAITKRRPYGEEQTL